MLVLIGVNLSVMPTKFIEKVAFLGIGYIQFSDQNGRVPTEPTLDNVPGRYLFAPYFGKPFSPMGERERTEGDLCQVFSSGIDGFMPCHGAAS